MANNPSKQKSMEALAATLFEDLEAPIFDGDSPAGNGITLRKDGVQLGTRGFFRSEPDDKFDIVRAIWYYLSPEIRVVSFTPEVIKALGHILPWVLAMELWMYVSSMQLNAAGIASAVVILLSMLIISPLVTKLTNEFGMRCPAFRLYRYVYKEEYEEDEPAASPTGLSVRYVPTTFSRKAMARANERAAKLAKAITDTPPIGSISFQEPAGAMALLFFLGAMSIWAGLYEVVRLTKDIYKPPRGVLSAILDSAGTMLGLSLAGLAVYFAGALVIGGAFDLRARLRSKSSRKPLAALRRLAWIAIPALLLLWIYVTHREEPTSVASHSTVQNGQRDQPQAGAVSAGAAQHPAPQRPIQQGMREAPAVDRQQTNANVEANRQAAGRSANAAAAEQAAEDRARTRRAMEQAGQDYAQAEQSARLEYQKESADARGTYNEDMQTARRELHQQQSAAKVTYDVAQRHSPRSPDVINAAQTTYRQLIADANVRYQAVAASAREKYKKAEADARKRYQDAIQQARSARDATRSGLRQSPEDLRMPLRSTTSESPTVSVPSAAAR